VVAIENTLPPGQVMEKKMTQLLNDGIIEQIREVFNDLKYPVHLIFFGSQEKCEYCNETRQLAEEVAAISDLVSIEILDIDANSDLAKKYNVDKAPGLVIAAKEGDQITDFGVRLAGIPSGHEFTSLIQVIILVSNRDSGLNPQTRALLKDLDRPILLQVFVTPT
jgi:alkyl hydroperoxide reductase subunit AhpF